MLSITQMPKRKVKSSTVLFGIQKGFAVPALTQNFLRLKTVNFTEISKKKLRLIELATCKIVTVMNI